MPPPPFKIALNNNTKALFAITYLCKTNDRSSRATRESVECKTLNISRCHTNELQKCINPGLHGREGFYHLSFAIKVTFAINPLQKMLLFLT